MYIHTCIYTLHTVLYNIIHILHIVYIRVVSLVQSIPSLTWVIMQGCSHRSRALLIKTVPFDLLSKGFELLISKAVTAHDTTTYDGMSSD